MKYIFRILSACILFFWSINVNAQRIGVGRTPTNDTPSKLVDYANPKEYIIGGITVTGVKFLDANTLISISGLNVNDKVEIPGEKISSAIKRLMDNGLLEEAAINITKVEDNKVFLELDLKERPRLNKLVLNGIKSGQRETLEEKINTFKGKVITEAMVKNIQHIIKRFYLDKGYLNTTVQVQQVVDSLRPNTAQLLFNIDRNNKVKIDEIQLNGLVEIPRWRALSKMKGTKQRAPLRVFTPSKFREKKYKEDKESLIGFLNKNGYRDAQITKDSVYKKPNGNVGIVLDVTEGNRFYYRNITWTGNYVRSTDSLNMVLGIEKGDVYNQEDLLKRLNGGNPQRGDVSSFYQDDGYLYFNVDPIEIAVVGDSIDIELRIREGRQATISKIILNGNTRTSDHVVMREILTKPGQKFSRTDLMESVQQLQRLGYFDPQSINPKPIPNQSDGTVNIEYTVEEKSNDNIELSGGYSALQGIIGTFGVVFNNFSARKLLNFKEYKPLPKGDGQKLSLRFQANAGFQNYSVSFSEPWLGGKKPNSLSVSIWHSLQDLRKVRDRMMKAYGNNSFYGSQMFDSPYYQGYFKNTGLSLSYGKRLNWPDRNFNFSTVLSYQFYDVKDSYYLRGFQNGLAHDLSLGFNLSRYSLDNPQFTRTGSNVSLNATFNPPYSLLGMENKTEKLFIEGHKWMFDLNWYTPLIGKLVFHAKANMGFVGRYGTKVDYSPFGRFVLGGAGMGMQNSNSIGIELIGMRGYEEGIIYETPYNETPTANTFTRQGGIIYNKYAAELRYPVSLNPQATIYVLAFAEAGNNWGSYRDFNPFKVRRSAGVGARVFMAAFGLLGIDYGYAFDPIPGFANGGRKAFTFSIGQQIR